MRVPEWEGSYGCKGCGDDAVAGEGEGEDEG
jgi:hypothetical protein